MENMLKSLPWKSLNDFWHAIESGTADLSMSRSTTFKIASINHPHIIITGVFVPYIISTILFVFLCIILECPWAIFLIIPNFIYAIFAYNINSFHSMFMWGVIILSVFFTLPIWIFLWAISIYLCKIIDSFFYSLAWKYTYQELRYNEEFFCELYYNRLIAMIDVYGNFYRFNPFKEEVSE